MTNHDPKIAARLLRTAQAARSHPQLFRIGATWLNDKMGKWVNHHGVTYLMLMFSIVIIGISVTAAAKQWKTMVQREMEADLLARGIEIQRAVQLYSATKKKGRVIRGEFYPRSLEELTKRPKPFLRKAYQDPIMRGEWEYVRAPGGGIKGVRSRSKAVPIKQGAFPPEVRHFEGTSSYHDWTFEHPNPSTPQQPPGSKGPQTKPPASPGPGTPSPP